MTYEVVIQWLWDNFPYIMLALNFLFNVLTYRRTGKIPVDEKQKISIKAVKLLNKAKKYVDKINEGDENGDV